MAKLAHLTLWPVLSQQLGLREGGFSALLCSDWSCSTRGCPASALLGDPRGWPAIWSHWSFPFLVSSLVPGGGGCYCPWQLAAGLLSFRVCGPPVGPLAGTGPVKPPSSHPAPVPSDKRKSWLAESQDPVGGIWGAEPGVGTPRE